MRTSHAEVRIDHVMCGITGYQLFSDSITTLSTSLEKAVTSLGFRGPDFHDSFYDKKVGLGHTRLSIIDTSSMGHQPMTDPSGRYTLVFNGEIYNYKALQHQLQFSAFRSSSDTEVLLHLLIERGESCLTDLNGFFAFALYDSKEETLLLARDRMGIKPLHYYAGPDFFAFGSEMKALSHFPIERKINHEALYWYLRLTYTPHELSMMDGVKKLLPGHYIKVSNKQIAVSAFWKMEPPEPIFGDIASAENKLVSLLEQSVERRMVSDVPLGAFLSGGTDSSVVVSMASRFNPNLQTFSIGYKDHPFFDETRYAELVAKKFNTEHTTFSLTNDDLLHDLPSIIDYIDEPFADSSAIPVFILSKKVSQSMKVALSGDGADELFGGYYKHQAFVRSSQSSTAHLLLKSTGRLLSALPQSRSSRMGNLIRRVSKYSDLLRLSTSEKYWHLASFNTQPNEFLTTPQSDTALKENILPFDPIDLNQFLDADLKLVLPGDMLTKVDLMSMANGLEVRVPFLDKEVVAFARSLPPHFKIRGNHRKKILQDAFEHILPRELHHRPKKGFEVPLLHWMRNELKEELKATVFDRDFVQSQGIFKTEKIEHLEKQLYSRNPGDVHSTLWSIYVFQKWYKRYF